MNERIAALLGEFGLTFTPATVEAVARFFELRARWAQAHNLSGPRALQDPLAIDLADSAALASLAEGGLPLLDVGAGSGVPAALLALLRGDLRVTAIEPAAKRAAFLRQVGAALDLRNLRVERVSWPVPLSEPVQVVSRAVFPVPEWPARAVEGGPSVRTVHRYLARERPPFGVDGFELSGFRDYAGPGGASHRLESWTRIPQV